MVIGNVMVSEHDPLLRCSRQCRMNPPLESFINEREALFMIRPTSIARGQYEAAAQPYPMPHLGDWRPEQYTLRSRDDGPSSLQLSQQMQPSSSNGCGPLEQLPFCIALRVLSRGQRTCAISALMCSQHRSCMVSHPPITGLRSR